MPHLYGLFKLGLTAAIVLLSCSQLLPWLCALQAAPCATAVSLAQHGGVAITQAGVGTAAAKADGASAAAAKTTANSASAVAVSNGGQAVSAADNRPL